MPEQLDMLDELCRRLRYTLRLQLVGPTNDRVRGEPIYPDGVFRLQVFAGADILAGRIQSDTGVETLDELAAGCLSTLRSKRLV